MKRFNISFEVTETVYYTTTVEANSEKEALRKFKNYDYPDAEWREEEQTGSDIDMDSVEIEEA